MAMHTWGLGCGEILVKFVLVFAILITWNLWKPCVTPLCLGRRSENAILQSFILIMAKLWSVLCAWNQHVISNKRFHYVVSLISLLGDLGLEEWESIRFRKNNSQTLKLRLWVFILKTEFCRVCQLSSDKWQGCWLSSTNKEKACWPG